MADEQDRTPRLPYAAPLSSSARTAAPIGRTDKALGFVEDEVGKGRDIFIAGQDTRLGLRCSDAQGAASILGLGFRSDDLSVGA